jgi:5-keto 4-deoxyuronate isomerase
MDVLDCLVVGGAVVDGSTGRVDLGRKRRTVASLFVPRSELGMYPIGAKVRVTVERVGR